MAADPGDALNVFISYSHRDESLRDELDDHLALLRREGAIRTWHDRKIVPGSNLDEEIDRNLLSADLILLLISPQFMASDYCFSREMERALERHAAREACVVPIILRPTDWQSAGFAKLLALPRDGKAITTWPDRDLAFVDVVRGIRTVFEEFRRARAAGRVESTPAVLSEPLLALAPAVPVKKIWTEPLLGIEFVYIDPGAFWMGSPESEAGRFNGEVRHRVTLTRGFWMARTAVTQAQFGKFVEATNYKTEAEGAKESGVWRKSGGPNHPAVYITRNDVQTFCQWLSECGDVEIYLPTEAEWEYAARAGSETATYAGDLTINKEGKASELESITWYKGNSGGKSHPVGEKEANAWGLYDMLGNVWEWVEDATDAGKTDTYKDGVLDPLCTDGSLRIIRGGSWYNSAQYCRAAFRSWTAPGYRLADLGFRLVRT